MKRKVSVIIPVYNCEGLLARAIESVVNQRDFDKNELILVDDGSTDGSALICDEYAGKHENITVVHQKNAGVSVARNNGINIAQGEWIFFLDSDDYLLDDAFDLMLSCGEADIICAEYDSNGSELFTFEEIFSPGVYNYDEISGELNRLLSSLNQFFYPCWSKMFRLSIIKENNIMFPEGRKYAEDMVFVYSYLLHCKTVSFVKNKVYFYFVNEFNATSVIQKSYDTTLFIFKWQSDYFNKNNVALEEYCKLVESTFLYKSFLSLKTAATYMKGRDSVTYISEILNDNTFYNHYTGSDEYKVFKTKTDAMLDRFIRKKKPLMIYILFKMNEIKSKIFSKLAR